MRLAGPRIPSATSTPDFCFKRSTATWAQAQLARRQTVVSIGCGCSGDLVTFAGRVKIAIDPLSMSTKHLGLLMRDEAGSPTTYLSIGAEELPCSLILPTCMPECLDHMHYSAAALKKRDGF